nr:MAG TPA: hypothetical protein [Caudoviricetes sp.]
MFINITAFPERIAHLTSLSAPTLLYHNFGTLQRGAFFMPKIQKGARP